MKKIIVIAVVTLILGSVILALILTSLDNKERKSETLNKDGVIALVENTSIEITKEDFIEQEKSLEIMYDINNEEVNLTSAEIVDAILEDELLYEAAVEAGITITDKEIMDYALQTKEAYSQEDLTNKGQKIIKVQEALANELGVRPDEYFTHPKVLEQYKKELISAKYIETLSENGNLKNNETIDKVHEDLLDKYQKNIKINQKEIDSLKVDLS